MQQKIEDKALKTRGNCIGCSDCTGLCLSLMDLALLPEVVLKGARPAR